MDRVVRQTAIIELCGTYVRVDLLQEFHFLDHGLDLALKIDADKSGIVAVLAHLSQISLDIFALGLNHVG